MTLAQASLLQALVAADRRYRSLKAAHRPVGPDDRGIEVGHINGVGPRTARVLVECGLAEMAGGAIPSQTFLFLGRCSPYDDVMDCDETGGSR